MKLRCNKCKAVIIIDDENLEPGTNQYVCPRCEEIIKFQVGEPDPSPDPATAPTLNQSSDAPPPCPNAQRPRKPQASRPGSQNTGSQNNASNGGGMPRPPQKDNPKKGIGCFSVVCILLVCLAVLGYCLYLLLGTDEYSMFYDRGSELIDPDTIEVMEDSEEPQVNWYDFMSIDTIVEDSAYMDVPDTVYVRDTVYMREPEAEEVEPAYPNSAVRDDRPLSEIQKMGFRNGVNNLTGDILHKGERYPCRISFIYDAEADKVSDAEFVIMTSGTRVRLISMTVNDGSIDFRGEDRWNNFIVRLYGNKRYKGHLWWDDMQNELELRLEN